VGLGNSAIGKIGDCYSQNLKEIPRWTEALDRGELPIWRGISLSGEDRLRRVIIEAIMCHGKLDFAAIESEYEIDFMDYFAPELARLEKLAEDGLLILDEDGAEVTPAGRLLLRSVAMVFDQYLATDRAPQPRFSRVI
jgi:oxygen-independent coproporphyrinogen-3 oxidase